MHAAPDKGGGDGDLNPDWPAPPTMRDAAVLVPLVERPGGLTVLLTLRAPHLFDHGGQIAFPGGRIEPGDRDVVDTALRETEEETGIARAFVTPVGRLGAYVTGSAWRIFPVVGVLSVGFSATVNPDEVTEIFEVPLPFLLDAANRQLRTGTWQGRTRRFYAMAYGGYTIWGATAGILVALADRLTGANAPTR